ncbi:MAG: tetratricopeptide repeat protein [Pseudomonadota bacterium]
MIKHLFPGLACLALLAGCASNAPLALVKPAAPQLETLLGEADNALKGGHTDKATQALKQAAASYPADKAPWLKLAQLRFDAGVYGEAIAYAGEAIERDQDDTLALSIVAVSGLRVSSKALADLSHKNNLSGSVRSEAQDLAKLLRASLGEEVLVPSARKPAAPPPVKKQTATKSAPSSDPFGALK